MNKLHFYKICTLFLLTVLLIGCSRPLFTGNEVARVGDAVLTQEQLTKRLHEYNLQPEDAGQLVSQWVGEQLLYQAAIKHGLQHDKMLKNNLENYRRKLLGQAYLELTSTGATHVTQAEISNIYNETIETYYRSIDEARINHFILDSENEARRVQGILSRSRSGSDRKDIFSSYNVEAVTVQRGALIQPLDDAVFNRSSRSKTIGPIKSDRGYHVIEILERYKEGTYRDIDEVYDELRHQLYQNHIALNVVNVLDSLRANTHIEINLGNFNQ